MLGAFYAFALLTILCRTVAFGVDAIFLAREDIGPRIVSSDLYQALSSLPSFTYVIMGNIIFLFIMELIVQNKAKPHAMMPHYKTVMRRRQRLMATVKVIVLCEILVVLALYTTALVYRATYYNPNDEAGLL
jgi:hypothetical protein